MLLKLVLFINNTQFPLKVFVRKNYQLHFSSFWWFVFLYTWEMRGGSPTSQGLKQLMYELWCFWNSVQDKCDFVHEIPSVLNVTHTFFWFVFSFELLSSMADSCGVVSVLHWCHQTWHGYNWSVQASAFLQIPEEFSQGNISYLKINKRFGLVLSVFHLLHSAVDVSLQRFHLKRQKSTNFNDKGQWFLM